jgi:hypothetical protein
MSTQLKRTEEQIERLKRQLLALGPMRPGSITRQYRLPKEKERPFYQISYTHRMRGHSEYVRPENLATLRKETATFKRFRKLMDRWIGLALAASQLRIRQAAKRVATQRRSRYS